MDVWMDETLLWFCEAYASQCTQPAILLLLGQKKKKKEASGINHAAHVLKLDTLITDIL